MEERLDDRGSGSAATDMAGDRKLDAVAFTNKYGPFIKSTRLLYRVSLFTALFDTVFNAVENTVLGPAVDAAVDAPIFLMGNMRSGTSFLESALAMHPEVGHFTYGSQTFPRSPLALNILLKLMPWLDEPMTPIHMPTSIVTAKSPFEGEPIWRFCRNNCWTSDPVNVLDKAFEDPQFESVLRRTIVKHLRSQGKRRFTNKNPWNTYRAGYLARVFPDARFIYIVRHPYRMLRSQLDLGQMARRAFEGMPRFSERFSDAFGPERVFFRTARYGEIMEAYQRDTAHGTAISIADCDEVFDRSVAAGGIEPRLTRLRYEDLVSDFHGEMARVFQGAALNSGQTAAAIDEAASTLLRQNLRSHQSAMPRFTPAAEAALEPMLLKYGYER